MNNFVHTINFYLNFMFDTVDFILKYRLDYQPLNYKYF